jgi:hypothetical protein
MLPLLRLIALTPALAVHAAEPASFPPTRKTQECVPRNGLPNFLKKAQAGSRLKVAYLGGSITAQPGYRVKTLAHFRAIYPQSQFEEINAAIGGTGSDLGAYRVEQDALRHHPDLLFIEFAVNDGAALPKDIVRAMEGIVRKTWRLLPECDICFVYTFTESLLPELRAGQLNRSAASMEVVADHYGIPTVHLGLEAVRLESEGKLLMRAPEAKVERVSGDALNQAAPIPVSPDGKIPFSMDGVHPYVDTGHALYSQAWIRSLPKMASEKAGPRSLPSPLEPLNFENTAVVPLASAARSGSWTELPADHVFSKQFSQRIGKVWKGEPGAELTFRFKGHSVKLYDLLTPDSGLLEVSVDGKTSERRRFDSYCVYSRIGSVTLATGLDPNAVHEVRIRVLPGPLDKEKILFERNRAEFSKDPARFKEHFWYGGAILLCGEWIP